MSPDAIPRRAALAALGALAACGFAPAYAPGAVGDRLRGQVGVSAPATPDGARLARRLEDRLGPAPTPRAVLDVDLAVDAVEASVTPDGSTIRYDLVARAAWTLTGAAEGSRATLASGVETGFAGYGATGTTVALRAAEADARERLATQLADAIVTRLLVAAPDLSVPLPLSASAP